MRRAVIQSNAREPNRAISPGSVGFLAGLGLVKADQQRKAIDEQTRAIREQTNELRRQGRRR
jgi:hypothetical protein